MTSLYPPFVRTLPPNASVAVGFLTPDEQMDRYLQGRRVNGPHAGDAGYPTMGLTVTDERPLDSPHNFGIAAVLQDGSEFVLNIGAKGVSIARLRAEYLRRKKVQDVWDFLDRFGPW